MELITWFRAVQSRLFLLYCEGGVMSYLTPSKTRALLFVSGNRPFDLRLELCHIWVSFIGIHSSVDNIYSTSKCKRKATQNSVHGFKLQSHLRLL
jgi:hypothetical protein